MRLLVTIALWCAATTAWADVLPSPERPEFEHTPVPMPDVPTGIMIVAVMLIAGYWAKRRQEA